MENLEQYFIEHSLLDDYQDDYKVIDSEWEQ